MNDFHHLNAAFAEVMAALNDTPEGIEAADAKIAALYAGADINPLTPPASFPVPGKPWLTASSQSPTGDSPVSPIYQSGAIVACAPELLDHPALREQEGFALIYDRTDLQDYHRAYTQMQYAQRADNVLPRFPVGLYDVGSLLELEQFLELHPRRLKLSESPENTTHPTGGASVEPPPTSDTSSALSPLGQTSATPAFPAMD